jgi:poly(A) polymerase Pap1
MDIDDDAVLRGVDAKTYLSLNGPRTTNMISRLIPASAQVKEVSEHSTAQHSTAQQA